MVDQVEVDKAINLGELLELGLQRRSRNCPRDRVGLTYHLESASEPGKYSRLIGGYKTILISDWLMQG